MHKSIFFIVFLLCLSLSLASNNSTASEYGELPQGAYKEVAVDVSVVSLSHLFVMTRGFVDVVFKPFSSIEEFIYSVITEGNDFLQELLSQWQTLAQFEVGYMTCLVAGLLFIILVPVVGLIMCCCRTCCDNCGGKMYQSETRTQSKWRHCFSVSLLIITVFIFVPCIFVFLTNEWFTQVVKIIPEKTSQTFSDMTTYVNTVPDQFDYIIEQYRKLDSRLTSDVKDLGTQVGFPVRDQFLQLAQPALDDLEKFSNDSKKAQAALVRINASLAVIQLNVVGINSSLLAVHDNLTTTLSGPECNVSECNQTLSQLNTLTLGGDFSSLQSVDSQLNSINNVLSTYDIDADIQKVYDEINQIPDAITNSSKDVTDQILSALSDVNQTLESSSEQLPFESVTQFVNSLTNLNSSVFNAFTTYDQYDVYRYAAGITLAAIILLICVAYFIGMLLGCGSYTDRNPADRGCVSNCGGILIMSGVGFSFIFGVFFMILVVLGFTVGGHGERYVCQNFESPYEGLAFAEKVLNATPNGLSLNSINPDVELSFVDILNSCEKNQSIYEALKLVYRFNVTELVANVTSQINSLDSNLADLNVNLSSIVVYSSDVENGLNSIKTAGLDQIDFTSFYTQISKGITATDLITFAELLNDTAASLSSSSLAGTLQANSYALLTIQTEQVEPLDQQLVTLNESVTELSSIASGLNASVDNITAELQLLDTTIQTNGSVIVKNAVIAFTNQTTGNVTNFSDWLLIQVTKHFGACRPLFLAYTQFVSILCDYMMDILNGLWFSLGWVSFFLLPGAIIGMKLAKFYRRLDENGSEDNYSNTHWSELEMDAINRSNNNGNTLVASNKFRSAKIHPSQYY